MPTLDWIGKKAVENHHHQVPFHILKEDSKLTFNGSENGNLLVEGDNLLALKALLPYYAGQVKCIYIDPPYNTGNENWIYNDNVNSPEIRRWLGKVVGGETEDLTRHDKWLCMMYPRLYLLKHLLRADGALFVSIDDMEFHNLIFLLNDIFGENNHLFTAIWQHSVQPKGYSGKISVHHNFIVCYQASNHFQLNDLHRRDEHNVNYSNPDDDPKGAWRSGDVRNSLYRKNLIYDLHTPSGKKIKPPPKGWRWSKETIKEKISTGEIVFRANETKIIRKIYLKNQTGRSPESIWFGEDVGTTREANQEIKKVFEGKVIFDTPKPLNLIKRILEISTDSNAIILDSFAGSGTTGHAVMQLNKEDQGNRKCILVEMDSNICKNVTSERLKRVAKGYTEPGGQKIDGLGGGFSYCRLGPVCFDEHGRINPEVSYDELARYVFFSETGVPLPKKKKHSGPLVGVHDGSAIYLLYNGVLKDTENNSGNVLTRTVLGLLPVHQGLKVVYGTACRLSASRLRVENIVFRQIPYEIRIK